MYGLGATLFFLLAGESPFAGRPAVEKLAALELADPPDLTTLRPDVPSELAAVVARMLARDPAARPQTPAEVVAVLAPFVDRSPATWTRPRTVPRRGRRWAAPAAGLLLVGVLTAWVLTRPPAETVAVDTTPPATNEESSRPRPFAPAASADGRLVYRLNLTDLSPLTARIDHQSHNSQLGTPAWWWCNTWSDESVGELVAERRGDEMALGLRSLSGPPAIQFGTSHAENSPIRVLAGHRYEARLEYQASERTAGRVTANWGSRNGESDWVFLPPTGAEWRTATVRITASRDHGLVFVVFNDSAGRDHPLYVRGFELIEYPE